MSYKEFQEKTENSPATLIGYIAVANIQGVDYDDDMSYFAINLLTAAFSNMSSFNMENYFLVIDDTQPGGTIQKDSNATNTIYVSEFGNHVMEYVNAMYSEKQTYKDTSGINCFEMSTEIKDSAASTCKLVTTVSVNIDADFSQIKGYTNKIQNAFNDNDNDNSSNIENHFKK